MAFTAHSPALLLTSSPYGLMSSGSCDEMFAGSTPVSELPFKRILVADLSCASAHDMEPFSSLPEVALNCVPGRFSFSIPPYGLLVRAAAL